MIGRLFCLLGRHDWQNKIVEYGGKFVLRRLCSRCGLKRYFMFGEGWYEIKRGEYDRFERRGGYSDESGIIGDNW